MSEKETVEKGSKISRKNAIVEVDKMFDYYSIDLNGIEDKDSKTSIVKVRSKLIRAVMDGRLEFDYGNDEKGYSSLKCIQHLVSRKDGHHKKMVYREVDGKSKVQMKNCGEEDAMGKLQAMMASLSDNDPPAMLKLRGKDLGLMENLAVLFLAV